MSRFWRPGLDKLPFEEREKMIEQEWQSCDDPKEMEEYLLYGTETGDRTLRLYGIACVRRVWNRLKDERSREAIEIAEKYIDGLATEQELGDAHSLALSAVADLYGEDLGDFTPEDHVVILTEADGGKDGYGHVWLDSEAALHCRFLRCIFGNYSTLQCRVHSSITAGRTHQNP